MLFCSLFPITVAGPIKQGTLGYFAGFDLLHVIYVYVYVYVHVHVHVHVHIHLHVHVHVHACTHLCMHVCMYVCIYEYIYMYIIYIYMIMFSGLNQIISPPWAILGH